MGIRSIHLVDERLQWTVVQGDPMSDRTPLETSRTVKAWVIVDSDGVVATNGPSGTVKVYLESRDALNNSLPEYRFTRVVPCQITYEVER
jgi:hypothetical protein